MGAFPFNSWWNCSLQPPRKISIFHLPNWGNIAKGVGTVYRHQGFTIPQKERRRSVDPVHLGPSYFPVECILWATNVPLERITRRIHRRRRCLQSRVSTKQSGCPEYFRGVIFSPLSRDDWQDLALDSSRSD